MRKTYDNDQILVEFRLGPTWYPLMGIDTDKGVLLGLRNDGGVYLCPGEMAEEVRLMTEERRATAAFANRTLRECLEGH